MKSRALQPLLWMVAAFAVSFLVVWPLMRPGFFISDDGEWMVVRLSAFYQSLREGQFPVRFLGRLNHSYGYPVSNFLYPGFLYLGSLLRFVGFHFVESVKIILGVSVAGAAISIFLWLRFFFPPLASLLGSVAFVLSPYIGYDLYTRGSVGELLAIFALTLSLLFIEAGWRWVLVGSVALLITAHNSLALMFSPFLVVYLLVRRKNPMLWSVLLGVGIASFFWIPALVERGLVIFNDLKIATPTEYFVDRRFWMLVDFVTIGAALLLVRGHGQSKHLATRRMLLAGTVASFLLTTSASSFLWSIPTVANVIQFPYRFLSLISVTGAWIVAAAYTEIGKRLRVVLLVAATLFWIATLVRTLSGIQYVERPEGYYTTNEATTTVADEYMPRWVREKPRGRKYQRLEFYEGGGTITYRVNSTQRIDATIETQDTSTVQINSIYYPGWGVAVDNVGTAIDYGNQQGLMRVVIPSGTHRLAAEFRETVPRFIADAVSFGALVTWAVVWIVSRFRPKSARYRTLS